MAADPAPRLDVPGCYEIYGSEEAAMITHTTAQALGRPGWPTCTTKPGVMRWSAPLGGPAAPGANPAAKDICRQTEKGDQVIRDG